MFDKFKQIFHSPTSFFNYGFTERTTWIAIALAVFSFIFRADIETLIHNCLTDSQTTAILISYLPQIISFILVWVKEKK